MYSRINPSILDTLGQEGLSLLYEGVLKKFMQALIEGALFAWQSMENHLVQWQWNLNCPSFHYRNILLSEHHEEKLLTQHASLRCQL